MKSSASKHDEIVGISLCFLGFPVQVTVIYFRSLFIESLASKSVHNTLTHITFAHEDE